MDRSTPRRCAATPSAPSAACPAAACALSEHLKRADGRQTRIVPLGRRGARVERGDVAGGVDCPTGGQRRRGLCGHLHVVLAQRGTHQCHRARVAATLHRAGGELPHARPVRLLPRTAQELPRGFAAEIAAQVDDLVAHVLRGIPVELAEMRHRAVLEDLRQRRRARVAHLRRPVAQPAHQQRHVGAPPQLAERLRGGHQRLRAPGIRHAEQEDLRQRLRLRTRRRVDERPRAGKSHECRVAQLRQGPHRVDHDARIAVEQQRLDITGGTRIALAAERARGVGAHQRILVGGARAYRREHAVGPHHLLERVSRLPAHARIVVTGQGDERRDGQRVHTTREPERRLAAHRRHAVSRQVEQGRERRAQSELAQRLRRLQPHVGGRVVSQARQRGLRARSRDLAEREGEVGAHARIGVACQSRQRRQRGRIAQAAERDHRAPPYRRIAFAQRPDHDGRVREPRALCRRDPPHQCRPPRGRRGRRRAHPEYQRAHHGPTEPHRPSHVHSLSSPVMTNAPSPPVRRRRVAV